MISKSVIYFNLPISVFSACMESKKFELEDTYLCIRLIKLLMIIGEFLIRSILNIIILLTVTNAFLSASSSNESSITFMADANSSVGFNHGISSILNGTLSF
jgi:hypothetical protein